MLTEVMQIRHVRPAAIVPHGSDKARLRSEVGAATAQLLVRVEGIANVSETSAGGLKLGLVKELDQGGVIKVASVDI
jgi:hypothetical protein